MVDFEIFGNCLFRTSIRPSLLSSLPWTASLNAGISSVGTTFLGFCVALLPEVPDFLVSLILIEFAALLFGPFIPALVSLMVLRGSRGGCIKPAGVGVSQ